MRHTRLKELRQEMEPFTQSSWVKGMGLFIADYSALIIGIVGTFYFDHWALKLLSSIMAGMMIGNLMTLGHDAGHGSLVPNQTVNRILGIWAMMPALHNFTLWVYEHHKLHHAFTGFQARDSWAPYSKAEFDALPWWERALEKLNRTPVGLGLYYLRHRWWALKFHPKTPPYPKRIFPQAWLRFSYLIAFAAIWWTGLYFGAQYAGVSFASAWLFGFFIPWMTWNYLMGFTVYAQHTHPKVPWFNESTEWQKLQGQEDVTPHLRFPWWYNLVSHNVMEHLVHHIDMKVPCYNLRKAQDHMNKALGEDLIYEKVTLLGFISNMRKCKIYDFENHRWLDWKGNPTTESTMKPQRLVELEAMALAQNMRPAKPQVAVA